MSDEEEDGGGGAGWIVSYADLMTLLFATFVVLYGLKPEGESKNVLGVTSSIRESFVEIPDVIPEEERKGPIKQGKRAYQHFKGELMSPPIIQKYRRASNAIKVIDNDLDQLKKIIKDINSNISQKPVVNKSKEAVQVSRKDNELRLRIMAGVLYEPGQVRPKREMLAKLEKLGEALKSIDRNFVIEGHTDSSLPRGDTTNWEISIGRAAYMARLFANRVGVPKGRISAAGYADTRPVADNGSAHGRKLNRRVEIKIKYEGYD